MKVQRTEQPRGIVRTAHIWKQANPHTRGHKAPFEYQVAGMSESLSVAFKTLEAAIGWATQRGFVVDLGKVVRS